jgi:hypothetical protein
MLHSLETFRSGILHRRSQDQNPRHILLPLPTIKDEVIIVPQRLEVVSLDRSQCIICRQRSHFAPSASILLMCDFCGLASCVEWYAHNNVGPPAGRVTNV